VRPKITGRRIIFLVIGIAGFMAAYSIGSAVPLSDQDAKELRKQFSNQIGGIDQTGIFLNNVRIALGMFIPAGGDVLGAFSGFETGSVFAAMAKSSPSLAQVPPLLILLTPFGIMEVFAYGLAMSRSGMLVYRLAKDKPWISGRGHEFIVGSIIPTLIEMGIVAAVLFAGAVIEWAFIQQLGGINMSSLG
jgi:hypothetical protein